MAQDVMPKVLTKESDPDTINALASVYIAFGQHQDARHLLNLSFALRPDYPKTLELLACVAFQMRDFRQVSRITNIMARFGLERSEEVSICRQLADIVLKSRKSAKAD